MGDAGPVSPGRIPTFAAAEAMIVRYSAETS